MAEQVDPAAPAAPQPKKSKLLFVLLGVVLVLAGSAAAWLLRAHAGGAQAAVAKVEKKQPEFTMRLDSFTVNLNDQEESHFLRVTMELGLAHAPKGGAGREGAESSDFPVARTRDTILSVLTAAKANELLTPEGKEALKHSMLTALEQRVPEIEAKDVYFTEFLVQR